MSLIAVVPCRKNSKRLPDKNKRKFGDRPLIDYTLRAALDSNSISRIILTTDDEDIINYVEKEYKMSSILIDRRPAEYAEDHTATSEVISYLMRTYDVFKVFKDHIILQVTSPLRTAEDIDFFYTAYKYYGKPSLISICNLSNSKPNGAIYIRDNQDFINNPVGIPQYTQILKLSGDGIKDIDIDTIEDFEEAQRRLWSV